MKILTKLKRHLKLNNSKIESRNERVKLMLEMTHGVQPFKFREPAEVFDAAFGAGQWDRSKAVWMVQRDDNDSA